MFRQVAGQKRWTLIAPEQSRWLCPNLIGAYIAIQTCVHDFEPQLRDEWFERIPRLQVVLEPGDMLFNPPWYWHDVVALRNGHKQASVAGRMNLRKQSILNGPVQSALVIGGQLRLQAKLAEARAKSGGAGEVNLQRELEIFISDNWRNDCIAAGRQDCEGLPRPRQF